MASSTVSTASSGYGSQAGAFVNPNFACHWLDSCGGRHELDQCPHWKQELNGKKGIYYSPIGMYRRFSRDGITGKDLSKNRTGCTTVYLLIYTIRAENEVEILFGLQSMREKGDTSDPHQMLVLPWAKPFKGHVSGKPFAFRAFKWISDREDIFNENFKPRFFFQHASVIYPLHLTNEQADVVTRRFTPNEILLSLHWFPLTEVLDRLPPWNNHLISGETPTELAQHEDIDPTGIQLGPYVLWSGTSEVSDVHSSACA